MLPWEGTKITPAQQQAVKTFVMGLSKNEFTLLAPESEVAPGFRFLMDQHVIVATILLKLDRGLEAKRYELVPDLIEEEAFWRNYFFAIGQFKASQGIPEEEQLELEEDSQPSHAVSESPRVLQTTTSSSPSRSA